MSVSQNFNNVTDDDILNISGINEQEMIDKLNELKRYNQKQKIERYKSKHPVNITSFISKIPVKAS